MELFIESRIQNDKNTDWKENIVYIECIENVENSFHVTQYDPKVALPFDCIYRLGCWWLSFFPWHSV